MRSEKIQFQNVYGHTLAARLELPADRHPHNFAVFAHVFTGNKNLTAVRHISRALTTSGIAVLRFDFTGLGESEGSFADTNFTSNVEDLVSAAEYLKTHYQAPSILIGHSLGGAAAIFAAGEIDSIKAVATIGAPSEPEHVSHLLASSLEQIEKKGVATVAIGGRQFTIKKQFLQDLRDKNMFARLRNLRKAILVLHSPQDRIVEIENAANIYSAAYHPKSFVTLDGADHMLSNKKDANYAGLMIASWVKRYIDIPKKNLLRTEKDVVTQLGNIGYSTEIIAGRHGLIADEPEDLGGDDFGPSPYQLLSASLGACTAMTLQMYARRKKWDLQKVNVHLNHGKRYAEDCGTCEQSNSRIDHFERCIELEGDLTEEQIQRLLEIADRCPVHRTLHREVVITTTLLRD
ncbi:MAG: bifunctional alpha/beta hydrolase/OsmC family protein [Bacteroidota bacterium]